ncbi:MAG TPA: hypothetical protein VF440_03595 [Novosphingobium sp.]
MISQSLARLTFWLLAAVVLFLALVPGQLGAIIASDTERHYLAFLVLPAVALYGWPRSSPLLLWIAFAGFGGLIEMLQYEMNLGRAAEMSDWINDLSATTIALMVGTLAIRVRGFDKTA